MRFQRMLEALLLLLGLVTGDVTWAYVTFGSVVLQVISPWLVPVALSVAAMDRRARPHAPGDLYYDLAGSRGSCIVSTLVMSLGLGLVHLGSPAAGWIVLALPAASLVLAPTVGFCAGCTFYILSREWLARRGLVRRSIDGIHDFDVETIVADRQ